MVVVATSRFIGERFDFLFGKLGSFHRFGHSPEDEERVAIFTYELHFDLGILRFHS